MTDDPYGVKSPASRRPPPSPPQPQLHQPQQPSNFSHSPLPIGTTGNNRVTPPTTGLRNRPPSPVSNIVVQQRSPASNGVVIQSSVAITSGPVGTKRTPTPAPSNRTPLPSPMNGGPVPAVTKTSALSNSPTTSLNDCNPPAIVEKQGRQPSPSSTSATSQGTIGRKVKAVSGLANKIQRRVVAGVVGQTGSRQQKSSGDSSGGKDQNIRSTQV